MSAAAGGGSAFHGLFHPRGIAIVGASADLTRIGGHPIKALKKAGYAGRIYPVNPKYEEIAGLRCYPSLAAIDGPCDLAVVAVPAAGVPAAIRACGAAGIGFAVVLSAGFRETGAAGRRLEGELLAAAREAAVRVIGPNCQGVLSIHDRVWTVFGSVAEETELRAGAISCAFQSGGFGYAIVNLAELQGAGFRYCVSTGNEADVTMPELLAAFLEDPGTSVVFGVLEGTPDARRLLDVGARSLATGKPVLIWKCAETEAGAKAAASHTANLVGRADVYRAAMRQSGLIEVDDVEPIVDFARVAGQGRLPAGRAIGALSISGGSGIVLADRAVKRGLTLPAFSETTLEALARIIPAFGSIHNPADVTAGVFNDMSLLTRTIEIVLADPGIDQLAILLASIPGAPAERAAEAIVAAARTTAKPVQVAWSGRRAKSEAAYRLLEEARIPIVSTPVRLAEAMARLAQFAEARRRLAGRVHPPVPPLPAGLALPAGAVTLSEAESKRLLAAYGIATTREVLVRPGQDPRAAAAALRAPFAVKIVSRDIAHKTEAGGVRLAIAAEVLAAAVGEVTANARRAVPAARIDGVLVAEMASGLELLVGATHEDGFGPVVTLGLGGVLTEVLADVTHRIAPFGRETAHEMLDELKGARLLEGYRGSAPVDRAAIADLLVRLSSLAAALGSRLGEIDLNPVLASPDGAVVADALVVLR